MLWSIFERVRAGLQARKLITLRGAVHRAGGGDRRRARSRPFDFAVVDEAQDISVAHLRFFAALGGGSAQRSLLRRRPRPAHLPAAVLLEGARRGHPRPLAHPARQLPHLPPDPHAGGPPARPGGDRRGRQQREPQRHGFRVQRPAADDSRRSRAKPRKSKRSATGLRSRRRPACCRTSSACSSDPTAQLDRAQAAVEGSGLAVQGSR